MKTESMRAASMKTTPVVLITGAARRIGAATCIHLHKKGFNVIIHYNSSVSEATTLRDRLNSERSNSAKIFAADLNDMAHVQKLSDFAHHAWGRLDVLVNNASSFYPTPVDQATETQWEDLLNSNLKAPFFLSQKLRSILLKSKGCIVNIADIFSERPMPNHAIYSIAKAGNRMMTQSLALEFAPDIRVNSVAPGAILWPEDTEGNELINPEKLKLIPLECLGGTEAIVKAIEYLILASPYTTGQILKVDGGRSLS